MSSLINDESSLTAPQLEARAVSIALNYSFIFGFCMIFIRL